MDYRRLVCFALLALLYSAPGAAQLMIKDVKGCKVMNPFITSIDAVEVKWSGACKDGYVSGFGTLTSIWSKDSLEADFSEGQATYGIFKERRGVYEGPLKDNVPSGRGTLKHKNGFTLKSWFNKWSTSGAVEVTWPDGSHYTGEYDHQKDIVAGQGVLTAADGSIYEGAFRANKPEGQGTWRTAGGEVRSGTFAKGKLSGQGSITFAKGHKYSGKLLDDKPSGPGTLEYASGAKYEGGFSNGLPHGQGRFTQADGKALEGEFKAGELQVGTYNSGSQKFEINLKQGTCLEILADGTKQAAERPQLPDLSTN